MLVNSVSRSDVAAKSRTMKIAFKGESIWNTAKTNIENAAEKLGYSKALTNQIIYPERELSGFVHVDGIEEPIQVFIAQHNTTLGPAKGGIRMSSAVDGETVRGLATDMSVKNALANLPLGGGKSGIKIDPSNLNPHQRMDLFRKFTRFGSPIIGPDTYIPAPDMNTKASDMNIIMDEYSTLVKHTEPCVVTGKSITNQGSLGRHEATGLGVVHTAEEAMFRNGIIPEKATAAVQGSGNVGGIAAKYLHEKGVKVLGMSDMYGAIYNEKGLNVPEVLKDIAQKGTLTKYPHAEKITNADLLTLKVDVLVPAATQGQITENNAGKIMAKIIAEGANGPTTPAADKILTRNGVHVIPDVLANQGGVYVSHLEHIQNRTRKSWPIEEVFSQLATQMKSRYNDVFNFSKQNNVTMREAATMLAVQKIANALIDRGRVLK